MSNKTLKNIQKENSNVNTKTNQVSVGTRNINFSTERAGLGTPIIRSSSSFRKVSYIPFSSYSERYNTDNVYPQLIGKMAKSSPTNSRAIGRKIMMTVGQGIDLSKVNLNLKKVLNNLNPKKETIYDILCKVSSDFIKFGGFALKVTWGNDGYIKYLKHIPFEQVRVGTPINTGEELEIPYYVVSNNWEKMLNTNLETLKVFPAFNPDFFGKNSIQLDETGLPNPTEEQSMNAEQLYYYKDYTDSSSSGLLFYPVPDYIGGIDAIATEIEIAVSNKSVIDNGFGGKTIISYPYTPADDDTKDKLDIETKRAFTGADKNGGVVTIFNNGEQLKTEIKQLEALNGDIYTIMGKDAKQDIITAHGIPPILLEYNYGGGFNNRAEEMTVAYEQFQESTIKWYQQSILAILNTLVGYMGYDDKLEIIPFKNNSHSTSNNNDGNVSTQQTTSLETN